MNIVELLNETAKIVAVSDSEYERRFAINKFFKEARLSVTRSEVRRIEELKTKK